jgi:hypothetical protein
MPQKVNKRALANTVRARLANGESRREVFAALSPSAGEPLVAFMIANVPTKANQEKFKTLNAVLVGLLILLAVMKIPAFILIAQNFPLVAAVFAGLFIPMLNVCMAWEVAHYRGYAYRMTGFLGCVGLLKTLGAPELWEQDATGWMIAGFYFAVGIATIALSFYLAKKLYPDLGFRSARKNEADQSYLFS